MDIPAARPTFHLDVPPGSQHPGLTRLALGGLEWLCCFRQLNALHAAAGKLDPARPFADRLLDSLGAAYNISAGDRARIPATGPVVLVANHPTGGVECLALLSLLRSIRPDYKFLANYLLGAIPEFREECIFVDPMGGEGAAGRNVTPMKDALRFLRAGGMVVVFPAGSVSHYQWRNAAVTDGAWEPGIARLALAGRADVLPVFVNGGNSALFHAAGLVHPRLRTALLPREFLRHRGTRLEIRAGKPVPHARLAVFPDDGTCIAYLRQRTYALRHRGEPDAHRLTAPSDVPVAPREPSEVLDQEIRELPREQRVHAEGEYEIWTARSRQIPRLLLEIGRLREVSFREAGEGSGKERDLDRFDDEYLHLFVWQKAKQQVAGAYRVGHVDDLVRARGELGLYTSTLFRFRPELFKHMRPALELGRSFVRPEYQHSPALMLLWKGIGRYLVRNPQFRYLFGPVSISNAYPNYSRGVMVDFLSRLDFMSEWAKFVRPRRTFRSMRPTDQDPRMLGGGPSSLEDLSSLVSDLEPDGKGIPVLLRQYLRLGGRVLGFNLDPEFSWVLDCLVLVDLTRTEPSILRRYMGPEGAEAFLGFHAAQAPREKVTAGSGA
ncbi:MAG: lysophospholipid acyltransferase family protein [Planctomycetota bacterium]|nr:lysophospholipid acyltransferase family protein [Planctomycetota bacterium]